jgi:hypothetical protein
MKSAAYYSKQNHKANTLDTLNRQITNKKSQRTKQTPIDLKDNLNSFMPPSNAFKQNLQQPKRPDEPIFVIQQISSSDLGNVCSKKRPKEINYRSSQRSQAFFSDIASYRSYTEQRADRNLRVVKSNLRLQSQNSFDNRPIATASNVSAAPIVSTEYETKRNLTNTMRIINTGLQFYLIYKYVFDLCIKHTIYLITGDFFELEYLFLSIYGLIESLLIVVICLRREQQQESIKESKLKCLLLFSHILFYLLIGFIQLLNDMSPWNHKHYLRSMFDAEVTRYCVEMVLLLTLTAYELHVWHRLARN